MDHINIMVIKNSPINSNCYLITDMIKNKAIVIDPGSQDSGFLISMLQSSNTILEYILLTHEHFDHIWGVNEMKDKYQCKVICTDECSKCIIDKKKNLSYFFNNQSFETYPADILFDKTYSLDWNGNMINMMKTKGHSVGGMIIKLSDIIFSGDTVIKDKKTIIKLPYSSKDDLILSIIQIISLCNEKTIIYPGHGDHFVFNEFDVQNCI